MNYTRSVNRIDQSRVSFDMTNTITRSTVLGGVPVCSLISSSPHYEGSKNDFVGVREHHPRGLLVEVLLLSVRVQPSDDNLCHPFGS